MKLKRATDYAVRVLICLAEYDDLVSSRELSKRLRIPLNHLAKVVRTLAQGGYISTQKGKGGGIKLLVDPKKTDLKEIVKLFEGDMELSTCILHPTICTFSKKCPVRKKLSSIQNKMADLFSGITISEMVMAKAF